MKTRINRLIISSLLFIIGLLLTPSIHAQVPQGNGKPHQASLTWLVDSGATGFNVYRSTSATGSFSLLTPTPVTNLTSPAYVDAAVTQGTAYWWCVTALAPIPTGTFETACSSLVTGIIPKDPTTAPSGLQLAIQ